MLHACVIFEMINISEFTTHTAECYNNLYVCASTLCDPMDHSPPGSSVHGIFPARMLEWVAVSSSRDLFT